jgi:hypothetical protein
VEVFLLALEAAIYPTLIAAAFVLLTQPRPRRLLAIYVLAGLSISITAGLVIVFALKGSKLVQTDSSGPSWIADLVVGALALLAAVALRMRFDERIRRPKEKPRSTEEPWSERILARGSVPLVVISALVLNLPGAAYLIGLKDIAGGGHSDGAAVALIVGFNLIMFAFGEVPLLGLLFAPERTTELVGRFNAWLLSHGRDIAALVSTIFGVYLVVRGIAHS